MDTLYEILNTFRKNKLRTALTGFAVAWGIFMLIVLLGAGNGLINATKANFEERTINFVKIWPGWTSMPYQGFKHGRQIRFELDDLDYLKQQFPDIITTIIPQVSVWNRTVSVGTNYSSVTVLGEYPEKAIIDGYTISQGKGRFINQHDLNEKRKVAILHPQIADVLFPNQDPLGQYVKIDHILFQVVGIHDPVGGQESQWIIVPFTTAREVFNTGPWVRQIAMIVENLSTEEDGKKFNENLRKAIAQKKQFDHTDNSAIWIWNRLQNYLETQMIFRVLSIAIWIIGLFTLISGIVGVSNIMLISVKERTKEFGIRKAIGASPASILKVVVLESVIITAVFGYIGMFLGIAVTEGINAMMEAQQSGGGDMQMFTNPTVDLGIAISATLTLVIAGTLAGFFPARNAVRIKPVTALAAK
ncbi:MAG: ABC transporter permease [Bacteroidales bacterium]|jgi:putative ABC transport system permease protein|nr:ABC transporter permease [Bacteroidales bacterium]